jgi:hypothetical protein
MNPALFQNKSDDTPKIQNVVATIKMLRKNPSDKQKQQQFDLQEIA